MRKEIIKNRKKGRKEERKKGRKEEKVKRGMRGNNKEMEERKKK